MKKTMVRIFSLLALLVVAYAGYITFNAVKNPPRHKDPNPISYFAEENWPLRVDPKYKISITKPDFSMHRTLDYGTHQIAFHIYTDAYGSRVNQPGETTPSGVDIITSGESCALGYGLENEETFISILGRLTHSSVANFSAWGGTGGQCLVRLKRATSLVHPKILLYYFWEEHLISNIAQGANIGGPVLLEVPHVRKSKDGSLYLKLPKTPERDLELMRKWYLQTSIDGENTLRNDLFWVHYAAMRDLAKKIETVFGLHAQSIPGKIEAAKFILSEMDGIAKQNGATLVVLYVPYAFDKKVHETPKELIGFAKEKQIPFISMEAAFRNAIDLGIEILFKDGHFNAIGHRLMAEELPKVIIPLKRQNTM